MMSWSENGACLNWDSRDSLSATMQQMTSYSIMHVAKWSHLVLLGRLLLMF